jgi:hypothetical protein
LADMMEQHRQSGQVLGAVVDRLAEFTPRFEKAVQAQEAMGRQLDAHEVALAQTVEAVSHVASVIPMMSQLAAHSASLLNDTVQTRFSVENVIRQMPDLQNIRGDLAMALKAIEELGESIKQTKSLTAGLDVEIKHQGAVSARLESALVVAEQDRMSGLILKPGMGAALKSKLKRMLNNNDDSDQGGNSGSDEGRRNAS